MPSFSIEQKQRVWEHVGYTPHPGQMMIHQSDARFKVPCCGRRFGKSYSAVADMLPDFVLNHGATYWIVGPTYELGEREFSYLLEMVSNWKSVYNNKRTNITYSQTAGNYRIKFPWQTEVKVVSAEKPRSMQGKGLSGVIMSEAAEHNELTWNQYIRPALSDERGRAIFPSTPKGYNWYYDFWRRGAYGDQPEWDAWQFPSWANTIKYPLGEQDPEFVEIKRNTSPMVWAQEYEASFVSYEGKVYAEFDEKKHVTELSDTVRKYIGTWRNYWGIDFGFRDPFVVLDIMVDPMDRLYVWREYYVRGLAPIQHCDRLRRRENPAGFHVDCMFADPSGAGDIATLQLKLGQVFARRVEPMQAIEQGKMAMQGVELTDEFGDRTGEYEQRFFVDPSCENFIRELNTFAIKPTKGMIKREDYDHRYSHTPDAFRYFLGEYFVLGAGARLRDVFGLAQSRQVDSDTFFQYPQGDPFTFGVSAGM